MLLLIIMEKYGAATSGGAFKYNTSSKEYTGLNKNDGLIGTTITFGNCR